MKTLVVSYRMMVILGINNIPQSLSRVGAPSVTPHRESAPHTTDSKTSAALSTSPKQHANFLFLPLCKIRLIIYYFAKEKISLLVRMVLGTRYLC